MASRYDGLGDDDSDGVDFDVVDENDDTNIKMDKRFAKNSSKNKKDNKHRGQIMISLHDEPDQEDESISFDISKPNPDGTPPKIKAKDIDNNNINVAAYVLNQNQNLNNNNNTDTNIKKKQKKKKKKYKNKKNKKNKYNQNEVDLQPLSTNTNSYNINVNDGELNNDNDSDEFIQNPNQKQKQKQNKRNPVTKQKKTKKIFKKRSKRRRKLTKTEKIGKYIKTEVKWWLFVGVMIAIFVFSYSAINAGISEDIVLFYNNYNDITCHYINSEDITETETKTIGSMFKHSDVQNFFMSSTSCVIISFVSLIVGGFLICLKSFSRNARKSKLVAFIYSTICILALLLLFLWNIQLCINMMESLNDLLNGLSHCEDNDDIVISVPVNEAQQLLYEFDIFFVLFLPLIFVTVCLVWYVKIKLSSNL